MALYILTRFTLRVGPAHKIQVSLRGEACWLRSGRMTSRLAAVRADVRDFEDRTDAIFPVCFLAGFAGEPVRSKKNVILPNSGITETI